MIDVIIPCYNAHETLERTLLSIANQTIADKLQVILVDDKSDFGYEHIAEVFRGILNIKILTTKENSGCGVARREAVNNSNNPYMTFIDADDILIDALFLEGTLRYLEENKDCVVVSCSFLEVGQERVFMPHTDDMIWMFGKLYRRDFWEKNNIQFSHLRSNEDVEVNTKIKFSLKNKDYIHYVNQNMVYLWQFNPKSITRVDNYRYSFNEGIVGYFEAKMFAYTHPTVDREKATQEMVQQVPEMYNQYHAIITDRPDKKEYLDNVWKTFMQFWNTMAKVEWDKLTDLDRAFIFNNGQTRKREKHIIPKITFAQFIDMLNKGTYE
jgi:glycosyltransferase involved in cell wall biosynthesis